MTDEYLGDLEKTSIIAELFKVDKNKRDDNWISTFLENVADASFRCGDPQLIKGPDGFSYFNLLLPEPNQDFQCYVIKHIAPWLTENGIGVVFDATQNEAEWIFSSGDILDYVLNGKFSAEVEPSTVENGSSEFVEEKLEVLVGQPSEKYLPQKTRALLKAFLEAQGYQEPKILIMYRKNEKAISQELVFDFEEIKDPEKINRLIFWITWFLPRTYTITGLQSSDFKDSFRSL